MNKLLLLLLLPVYCYSQYDCENPMALGVSYILPKSISVEGTYFSEMGLAAGIGMGYSVPTKTTIKSGTEEMVVNSNMLDIFAYAGYRVFRIKYKFSAFINAGYTMGDVNDLTPFFSTKFLFPVGRKAMSIEPFYVVNRGYSGRATLYFKF